MKYYRCKCGKQYAWGSMPPAPCAVCPECNTILAEGPKEHFKPQPHNWIEQYDPDTGKKYTICSRCLADYPPKKEN